MNVVSFRVELCWNVNGMSKLIIGSMLEHVDRLGHVPIHIESIGLRFHVDGPLTISGLVLISDHGGVLLELMTTSNKVLMHVGITKRTTLVVNCWVVESTVSILMENDISRRLESAISSSRNGGPEPITNNSVESREVTLIYRND